MEALVRYAWPGNIRELQNVIERAVILSPGPALQVPLGDLQPADAQPQVPVDAGAVTLADAERQHILGALRDTGWVVAGPNGAAARLGMKRSTLQKKMQKLGISRPQWCRPGGSSAAPAAPAGGTCWPSPQTSQSACSASCSSETLCDSNCRGRRPRHGLCSGRCPSGMVARRR